MLLTLTAIGVLLLISAFFSGSETALSATSQPLIHQMAQAGDRRAKIVHRLQLNKERLIGTILLGNNLVNILASSLATSVMITLYGDLGVAYATLAMTLMVLIFAEILPKTYAIKFSNEAALSVAWPISHIVTILSPITISLSYLVRGVLKVVGIDVGNNESFTLSDEELRGAIELREGEEESDDQERAMLHSVLDLADVQVGEIMVHRTNVVGVDADLETETIIQQILDSPYTRIPLWRERPDNVIGVIHVKALLREIRAHGGDTSNLDLVTIAATPWFVPEQTPLLDQLQAFRSRREHFALIIDEYGSLMGVVTLEDILEEIVGDIADEHDVTVTGVDQKDDGTLLVDGSVTIRDLNREYGWNLPDEEASTVAGLILHESRRIPDTGQSFKFHNFRFDIVERERHQITSVRVTPPKGESDFTKTDRKA